jgi:hypothetical protein
MKENIDLGEIRRELEELRADLDMQIEEERENVRAESPTLIAPTWHTPTILVRGSQRCWTGWRDSTTWSRRPCRG